VDLRWGTIINEEKQVLPTTINLEQKLGLFAEQWSPKIIAERDGFQFKLAKLEGDFVWHSHADTDETFLVIEGELRIDFHDGAVKLKPGEMLIVPKGVEHKPFAESECHVMVLVREGTVNTGSAGENSLTADPAARI
jgi:mannose-6-phosphate isomerase-like protein (cupin superfamily)